MTKRTATILAASLALAACVVAEESTAASGSVSSVEGFIYGTVETRFGKTHTGVLRWDDEEAFWDDVFHSYKAELPYAEYEGDSGEDRDATWWERLARTIGDEFGVHRQRRVIAVRFGDLSQVRVTGADDAVLTLRDGSEIEVEGYANDVTATVTVIDDKPGRVEISWKKIETVTFAPTPPGVDPGSFRLQGAVSTTRGDFSGFIQWDSEEALSTDILDGDVDDERVRLEMGEIRSIEKRDRRSARVVLKDDTEMVMSGTNDVDDDIRGIFVEDARFGRVEVGWDEFERVVFDDPGGSGASYADFESPRRLSGTVTLKNGDWRKGDLVFDLDEEWSWEMLDGESGGIDYSVPFGLVKSIEPAGRAGCLVRLRNGLDLELENSHDVDEDNSGMVVIPADEGEPGHVAWDEIARIEFD
jgi:hypothetical protein